MSDKSSIEWTATYHDDGSVTPGATWNPIRGQTARHTCARISPGCDNCYAATMTRRGLMGTAPIDYGTGETPNDPARLDEKALRQPLTWRKPRKIFVCSMTDLFGSWVPDEWIARIFGVMALATQHTFIVLTKRPTRMRDVLRGWSTRDLKRGAIDALHPGKLDTGINNIARALLSTEHQAILKALASTVLPNVWIGTTIESDQYAWRADRLRQTPAAVRWVSAEPLLSGLPSLDLTGIDWLVTGGESGPKARPMHPDWARDLRDRCTASGTAFFHKQNGAFIPTGYDRDRDDPDWRRCTEVADATPNGQWLNLAGGQGFHGERLIRVERVGNHRSGRLLDGVTHDAFPRTEAPV